MAKPHDDDLTEAKRIAARLLAMPPKPHDEMKVGRDRKGAGKDKPGRRPQKSGQEVDKNRNRPKARG